MKVVINKRHGGFGLSDEAILWLCERVAKEGIANIERHNPLLVECVEALGNKANGEFARLDVVEIPDGINYTVEEDGGVEWIAEQHRTWG